MNILKEAVRLFGFQIGKKTPEEEIKSFAIPPNLDGASQITSGGIYGTYVDLEGTAKNESELITRYRDMSMQPECEMAIEDIVTDAIVQEDNAPAVEINLEQLEQPESIKKTITEEFRTILQLLNFNDDGMEIFKRWYVDGRLFYHIMIDPDAPNEGIKELRYLDPRKIRKMREIQRMPGNQGVELVNAVLEYYLYNERMIASVENNAAIGIKIATDSICYVHSGEIDSSRNMVVSYLHKAIKPLNQLRAIEDSHVIYRLSRAAERRIFYIDVGNMPTNRAEQYVKSIISDFRNKLVYDNVTGEVRDDKKFLSMQEDIFLPRREGGKGTEVTTLPGGNNLNQIEDIQYFQERLYKALHVPTTRIKSDNGFGMGRSAEISRDEVKFSRFITKLRKRFDHLFKELLRVQLVTKGVIMLDEWESFRTAMTFDYQKDSVFAEAQEQEIWTSRLALLQMFDPATPVDHYFSRHFIKKTILKQTDEEIEELEKQMEEEIPLAQEEQEREAALNTGAFFEQPDGGSVPPPAKKTPAATSKKKPDSGSGDKKKSDAPKKKPSEATKKKPTGGDKKKKDD
jgi:hypothetical protein